MLFRARILLTLSALAALGLIFAPNGPLDAAGSVLSGTVTHVRDGDTIEVDGVAVRLNGVSAPERDERYGPAASAFMEELVLGHEVQCQLNGERSYDRVIGRCYLNGADIGAAIIEAGLARDCPRYSGGRYRSENQVGINKGLMPSYRLPGYCN